MNTYTLTIVLTTDDNPTKWLPDVICDNLERGEELINLTLESIKENA